MALMTVKRHSSASASIPNVHTNICISKRYEKAPEFYSGKFKTIFIQHAVRRF